MDNSFDKLNNEFIDKQSSGGFKYWFWGICAYVCDIIGLGFAGFGFTEAAGGIGLYFSLLTLVLGAFGIQTNSWAKGSGKRGKFLLGSFIFGLVDVAIACIILYIAMPIIKSK